MSILDYVEPYYFFLGLVIGLVLVYLVVPAPTKVLKYPTPENAGKIVYKDANEVCYKYKASEVSCPSDPSKVEEIPLQDVDDSQSDPSANMMAWLQGKA